MQFYSYNVILVLFFLITCRYFSSQAWSGGPYPIAIPQTLRSALQDTSDPQMGGTGAARTSNWDNNSKRELRSVFDLVGHLCGRSVPGIPLASTLPTCPVDRVRQIHWMYSTLLTFLRYVHFTMGGWGEQFTILLIHRATTKLSYSFVSRLLLLFYFLCRQTICLSSAHVVFQVQFLLSFVESYGSISF